MMQTALRTRLLNDGTIAGLVGTRVDWDARPQAKALPAVTLSLPYDMRDQHMGGSQVTRMSTFQIDCWAEKAITAHTLGEAVVTAIQPAATVGGVRFLGAFPEVASSTETTEAGLVYRVMVRGQIAHTIP
jgi:hypothetical protein